MAHESGATTTGSVGADGAGLAVLLREFVAGERFEPPPLPAIAQTILGACSSRDAGAAQLADLVHRDAIIAGRVLKLANSAYFRRGTAARTLRDAIVRIGQNELRNLVLTVVLKSQTFNLPFARDFAVLCWRHSLACALAASLLASECRWTEPHRAFLGGLLHDLGKAVVLHAFGELQKRDASLSAHVRALPELAHALHTTVGRKIGRSWKLDDGLVETISLHHRPVDAKVEERLCSIVAFADAVTAEAGLGLEPPLPNLSTHPIGLAMGLDEEALGGLIERLPEMMARYDVD